MDRMNPAFRAFAETRARFRLSYGSAGSGKSVIVAQDFVKEVGEEPRMRLLCVRKIARTCRHSTYALFGDVLDALGRRAAVKENKSEMTFDFPGGGRIIHAGLDDVNKLKSIAGITHIWFEEATEASWPSAPGVASDIEQLDLRLRGIDPRLRPSLTLTFNPTLEARRLFKYVGVPEAMLPKQGYREFHNGTVFVQHSVWQQNPFVGPEYAETMRRLGDSVAAIYDRGELVAVDTPDQLIPYSAVKDALSRPLVEAEFDGRGRLAADVAAFGGDENVIMRAIGLGLVDVEAVTGQDTTTTGRRIASLGAEYGIDPALAVVDEVGLGRGAVDTARDAGFDVRGFVGGASPVPGVLNPDGSDFAAAAPEFNNLRSQAWYYLREQFLAGRVAFASTLSEEHVRKLTEDLVAPRYRIGQGRRLEVEPKDSPSGGSASYINPKAWGLRARLGRSPDYGDTLAMLAFAEHVRDRGTIPIIGTADRVLPERGGYVIPGNAPTWLPDVGGDTRHRMG